MEFLNIGFVYIDGNHDYKDVKADIEAWYPILNTDGILAGHDFELKPVYRAVVEFATYINHPIQLTTDFGKNSSWFIHKNAKPLRVKNKK